MNQRVPFLDLAAQYRSIETEIMETVARVLASTHYVLGPEVASFESEFADAHDCLHCVSVNNGTAALHLALWALGVGTGDEVILPVNTFIATAEAVSLCGATPVLVDHDEYFNLDPSLIETQITPRTKAIIAVHLYGQPARMPEIAAIAQRHKLLLIEDAAQAHLARYDDRSIGNWGSATCFSFYPGKNLGAYGEGGAVITNEKHLSDRMRLIRDHGSTEKYHHDVMGHNYRLEALQAAILRVKLRHLSAWTQARQRHAARYAELLAPVSQVCAPKVHEAASAVWHLYVIQAEQRDGLQQHLNAAGIGTGMHYPIALHKQRAFADYASATRAYPRSDATVGSLLSLPMFPEMTEAQQVDVVNTIKEFYSR